MAVVANEASAFVEPIGEEFGRIGMGGSKQLPLIEPALELAVLCTLDPPVAPL